MNDTQAHVAYLMIEAADLLTTCFAELDTQSGYKDASELMMRGTLPQNVLERIQKNTILVDPKGLQSRFTAQRRVYVDSWSELVALGSLTRFFERAQKAPVHYMACVGIETAYKESSLREKYLGDGAIASRQMGGRQIIQSCLAQNIKGKSAGKSLHQEIVTRLQEKLTNAPNEPARILAVTIMSETESIESLDFSQIAQDIEEQRQGQTTYEKIFCVIPGFGAQGKPRVAVVPLWDWLPGGNRLAAVVKVRANHDPILDVEFVLPAS